MNLLKYLTVTLALLTLNIACKNLKDTTGNPQIPSIQTSGIRSIDTGHTITKVRTAKDQKGSYIIASSFEGKILALDYDGKTRWVNDLSGFMNHDIYCADIDGDGVEEILAANADGHIYCIDQRGKTRWSFRENSAPMYKVTGVNHDGKFYVVASSFDKNLYYLSAEGKKVDTLASSAYGKTKKAKGGAKSNEHIVASIGTFTTPEGADHLALYTTSNSMQDKGQLQFLEPFAKKPYKSTTLKNKKPVGDLRITRFFGNGKEEILTGTSTHISKSGVAKFSLADGSSLLMDIGKKRKEFGGFAYMVVQTELIPTDKGHQYFVLAGSSIGILDADFSTKEVLPGKYAFNDLWQDQTNKKLLLASVQSGGSNIHILDYSNNDWKADYKKITPSGKIQKILSHTEKTRKELSDFKSPSWERSPKPVYFVSDLSVDKKSDAYKQVINEIHRKYDSPIFPGYTNSQKEDPATWSRDTMSNAFYRNRRDRRMKYVATQREILNKLTPVYDQYKGLAMWGGHGNDPYFYSMDTRKKLLDAADGKKTVLIFPELENDTEDFEYVLEDMLYPLATYGQRRNLNIHLRCKHIFWQGPAHRELWSRLSSGEFADVFVPSMEETTDKSMELSVAGRMGFWMSGAVNQWATRCVPDNQSFDRLQQFGSQRLPNHFLRQNIYNIANGATHLNNLSMDKDYMSLVWELVAKGALYVPERDELLSISPVHLSMTSTPDHGYLKEGADVKKLTYYNEEKEDNHKMVFSRLNGSWPGAPLTEWDFSRYAANETERRLNFIPNYNNGVVLITPVQNGALAKENQPRGKMIDKMHPIYKGITKEYITDGKNYLSADGQQTFPAETYYKKIKADIEASAALLPLTVTGNVGWVVAQTDPLHLRITLVDGGWINPDDQQLTINFQKAIPQKMTDLLSGETFQVAGKKSIDLVVPTGGYRFIDLELKEKL